jgi:cytochrome c oxidase assembly protein subunit 15
MSSKGFRRFALGTLVFNLAVIAWGAYVRATGSGAGCGSHWPLCKGEIVPRSAQMDTLIELTHRLSSGLSLVLVAGLVLWAFRTHPKGHLVRKSSAASGVLLLTEAALGAALVLYRLVGQDTSAARAVFIALHLVNTFLLLGALTLNVVFAWAPRPLRPRGSGRVGWLLSIGAGAVLLLGISGAINALGDTLFPAHTLQEGLAQDLATSTSLLLRLRVAHPVLAVGTAVLVTLASFAAARRRASDAVRRLAVAVGALFSLQMGLGVLNLVLLAPVWMQLVHLVAADSVWIAFVGLGAVALQEG